MESSSHLTDKEAETWSDILARVNRTEQESVPVWLPSLTVLCPFYTKNHTGT